MGGDDLCDMLLSLYRIKLGSNKWHVPIFNYFIQIAVTNGWLMYIRHCEQLHQGDSAKRMTLLEFQISRANDLTLYGKRPTVHIRRGCTSHSPTLPAKRSKTAAAVAVQTENYIY